MKIIFVCTGNTCRSPMAEYFMREYCHKNGLDITVESRGLSCFNGKSISENSWLALREVGIDASEHRSKLFTAEDAKADLIVTMTKGHKDALVNYFGSSCNVKTFGEATGIGDIEDPYGLGVEVYRSCRNKIEDGVKNLVEQLINE